MMKKIIDKKVTVVKEKRVMLEINDKTQLALSILKKYYKKPMKKIVLEMALDKIKKDVEYGQELYYMICNFNSGRSPQKLCGGEDDDATPNATAV